MLNENVTVCVFCWNESRRVLRCLENFKGLFPILVIDNCSTDDTVAKVTEAGYRVITIKNPGFIETPEVMDEVWQNIETDYLLIALTGEFIPLFLLKQYAEVARLQSHDVVRASRIAYTAGKLIPIVGKPNRSSEGELRFFRRGAVSYEGNKVHGRGRIQCEQIRVLSLAADETFVFFHFRDFDWAKTERTLANYNDVLARQMHLDGATFSFWKLAYHALKQFFVSYIKHGSWKWGMLGFMHSFARLYMEIAIWLRIWEWQNGLSWDGVVRANQEARAKIEDAFKSDLMSHFGQVERL